MSSEEMLEELREIRKLLTPAPPPEPPKGFINEFVAFLTKYQVLGLAVSFIMGIYLGALVEALVADLVMPIVQIPLGEGGPAWQEIMVGVFAVGHFAGALLTFIIVAIVIFILVKVAARMGIK